MYEKLCEKWKDILEVFNFNLGGTQHEQIIFNGKDLKYCKKEDRFWRES